MRARLAALALLLLSITSVCAGADPECRLYFAAQYDWAGRKGFYLDLEGTKLAELPLILAVGDGSDWRYPQQRGGLAFGTPYRLRAVVGPQGAKLFVNDTLVAEDAGRWQPAAGNLVIYDRPTWAQGPGDWIADVSRVRASVARPGKRPTSQQFTFGSDTSAVLRLFESYQPISVPFAATAQDTVTLEVDVTFDRADPAAYEPLIDRYGQCRYAEWPQKVRTDDDLSRDVAEEARRLAAMPPSPDFDQYGGYRKTGWTAKATGFFYTTKRDGFWWLISPEGNPTFYLGVDSVPASIFATTPVTGRERLFADLPPREGDYARAWGHDAWMAGEDTDCVSLHAANLVRKYGRDWLARAEAQSVTRLRAWGFSGGGKWGAPPSVVSTPVLDRNGVPNLADHPDIFDPAVQKVYRDHLAAQIGKERDNPRILGWTVSSERGELVQPEEITAIMKMAATVPAKRALLDHATDAIYRGSVPALAEAWGLAATTREQLYAATPAPPAADVEAMRLFYADRYYAFNYETVKSIDPNHLYLGCHLCPVCEERKEDFLLAARHADVASYDLYRPEYGGELLRELEREIDKPTFCGEFSYPAWYEGRRGFGRFSVFSKDDAEAGDKYAAWVKAAAADPNCVGGNWFEYRDQPLTGRGPGFGPNVIYGEHYAFGLITETDRPKWDLVTRMREANLHAARWRLEAAGRGLSARD
jgi:hypothetical protein